MDASKMLRMQTASPSLLAQSRSRSDVGTGDSADDASSTVSANSSSASSPTPGASSRSKLPAIPSEPAIVIRCSRCHLKAGRGALAPTLDEMIAFGTNVFYCARCASIVGYIR